MQTVTEQLVEALEMMVPLLQSFDNWCRIDRHGLCQSHLGEKQCSVAAARRAWGAALDRARAEPEALLREAGRARRKEGERVRDGK